MFSTNCPSVVHKQYHSVKMTANRSLLLLFYCMCLTFVVGCFRQPAKVNAPLLRIHVRDHWLVDTLGRVRIFHGINAVNKGPPWYPSYLLNSTLLAYMEDWGFNAVRLGTMWSGAFPVRNQLNQSYIDITKTLVSLLGQHGMYSLLDMHQDRLSSLFEGYDGAPLWLLQSFPPPSQKFPWPFRRLSSWPQAYLTDACSVAFQHIYDNTTNSLGYWAQFWREIALAFRDQTSTLGYELINEPWAGDVFGYPPLILPGEAGRINLQRVYDYLNDEIRQVDKQTLIFYEPVTWGIVLNSHYLGPGFSHVPGGNSYKNNSVFSWHYYCWVLDYDPSHPKGAYPKIERRICDKVLGPNVFKVIRKDIKQLGGSKFLTEFGTCAPDGNVNSTTTIECDFVLNEADVNLESWTYWDGIDSFVNQTTGQVYWSAVRAFARVYARAIAGIPTTMQFDISTRVFKLQYNLDTTITGSTEIFVPPLHYPKGFVVTVSPNVKWHWDEKTNTVYIDILKRFTSGSRYLMVLVDIRSK